MMSYAAMGLFTLFVIFELEPKPDVASNPTTVEERLVYLEMKSELAVDWLLLEGASIALEAQKKIDKSARDWAFYEGKKAAAVFFGMNVLPEVVATAKMLANGDQSALEIPDAAFATV